MPLTGVGVRGMPDLTSTRRVSVRLGETPRVSAEVLSKGTVLLAEEMSAEGMSAEEMSEELIPTETTAPKTPALSDKVPPLWEKEEGCSTEERSVEEEGTTVLTGEPPEVDVMRRWAAVEEAFRR